MLLLLMQNHTLQTIMIVVKIETGSISNMAAVYVQKRKHLYLSYELRLKM